LCWFDRSLQAMHRVRRAFYHGFCCVRVSINGLGWVRRAFYHGFCCVRVSIRSCCEVQCADFDRNLFSLSRNDIEFHALFAPPLEALPCV
jgi:hypothetical protein